MLKALVESHCKDGTKQAKSKVSSLFIMTLSIVVEISILETRKRIQTIEPQTFESSFLVT